SLAAPPQARGPDGERAREGAAGSAPAVLSCSASSGDGLDAVLAALRDAGAATAPDRIGRRRAQARRWTAAAMSLEFGRYGAASLASEIGDDSRPFAGQAAAAAAMRAALDRVLGSA
ncbi:MAG: hypothetical protein AAFQ75_12410, partial [Pseudomonadota bacterium]